jgi:hypothetical protein
LETIGTGSKFADGQAASATWRSMRRRPRSAIVLGERGEQACGEPALLRQPVRQRLAEIVMPSSPRSVKSDRPLDPADTPGGKSHEALGARHCATRRGVPLAAAPDVGGRAPRRSQDAGSGFRHGLTLPHAGERVRTSIAGRRSPKGGKTRSLGGSLTSVVSLPPASFSP